MIQYYYNPFAISGGLHIPIRLHPRVPPGTIIGWAENLLIQYQSNEVPNVAELKTRGCFREGLDHQLLQASRWTRQCRVFLGASCGFRRAGYCQPATGQCQSVLPTHAG